MVLIYSEANNKKLLNIPSNIYYMNTFTISLTIQFIQMIFKVQERSSTTCWLSVGMFYNKTVEFQKKMNQRNN